MSLQAINAAARQKYNNHSHIMLIKTHPNPASPSSTLQNFKYPARITMMWLNMERGGQFLRLLLLYSHKSHISKQKRKILPSENKRDTMSTQTQDELMPMKTPGRAEQLARFPRFMDHHSWHHLEFMNTCVCEKAFLGRPSSSCSFRSSCSTYSTETFSAFGNILTFIPCADVASSYL